MAASSGSAFEDKGSEDAVREMVEVSVVSAFLGQDQLRVSLLTGRFPMKLVTFQDPIFWTLQGEGVLAGTPSVFVRLWGCDFSCSWCDTKKSWEPSSKYVVLPPTDVLEQILYLGTRTRDVVITGGNPLLQADELAWLTHRLREHGKRTTVETQGSVFADFYCDLLSLSPKLHDWRPDTCVKLVIENALRGGWGVQVKVVVSGGDVPRALTLMEELDKRIPAPSDYEKHWFLQPEWSLGRGGVREVTMALEQYEGSLPVRVLPQLHKSALFVP